MPPPRRLSLVLVLIVLGGCAGAPSSGHDVLKAVNGFRAEHGLRPLSADGRLASVARHHAGDQARGGAISHAGGDGRRLEHRLSARRYGYRLAAENLASGQEEAWQVVRDWRASPSHRSAMLMPQARVAGVGVAEGRAGRRYWTLIVAAP